MRSGRVSSALALAVLVGCAGPEPVLYPNPHFNQVGKARADNDVAACRQMADAAGATSNASGGSQALTSAGGSALIGGAAGAVGGAIAGNAGIGAAVGAASGVTASLLQSMFGGQSVSGVHRAFVDRCLRERGYEPMGWE